MIKAYLKPFALFVLACSSAGAQDLMPMRLGLQAGLSPAPQFTFRVPVHLASILPGTRAFINCRPLRQSTVMAELDQEVPLDANGNFDGTVVVTGNLAPDKDPTTVDNYSCLLRLQGPGALHPSPPCFGESCPDWWRTKPRTLFRPAATGSVPR